MRCFYNLYGYGGKYGCLLLSSGAKGKRYALPNSDIMIHQPLGGFQGQASDIMIHANYIDRIKARLNKILSDNTGQPLEVIEKILTVTTLCLHKRLATMVLLIR